MNTLGLEHISHRRCLCSPSGEAQTAWAVGAVGVKACRCVEWEELAFTEHQLSRALLRVLGMGSMESPEKRAWRDH